ncbi:MAG: helix-turn-helix transcriptional regulator [Clostridia bacterium]|nr:helix-turn-helix transcriptional regulator [Clostridia bacterium]
MTNRNTYGLSFCRDGQITYIQDGAAYVSNKNCAVILPKGGTYFIKRDKTGTFPVINFDCLDFLCDTVTIVPVRNAEELTADYERMKKLFCFDGNRAQIFSIFYSMLHKLCSDDIPHELRGAVRLIRDDCCDVSLTNARLARECNISEVYFRKLFTKHFGISPKQYIIDLRIQKAKQMLAEGGMSVSVILEKCGFSNPYHFCRLFKQRVGITPSEYRKANLTYEI